MLPVHQSDLVATGSAAETAPLAPGRVSTGTHWLDLVLRGGLPKNRVYLLTGDPGTGKTTLSLQFLLEGVRRGEKGLFVTMAETREELLAVAESHEMDLAGIEVFEVAAAEQDRPEQDYTALDPAEVELGEHLEKIVALVERLKPQRVVIDSLTEIRLLSHEQVRYRRQIVALKNFLMRRGCTVYFIDDPASREATDGQLHTICHGVFSLEKLSPEYGRERRRIQVLKMRGVDFYGGYHDYTIQKGGLVIWPRLVAAEHARDFPAEAVASGVAELDQTMGGGLERGTTMLILGAAGVGKSTMCHQYCAAAAARGEYFAWFSFDERMETITSRGRAMGVDLDQLMADGKCHLAQVDPATLSPGEFIQQVRRQVETYHARIIVIDSLNGYMHAMPGERYLLIQMHELLSYLSQMGVLSFIVIAQHGLVGSHLEAPLDLSYLADTITLLRYFEHGGRLRRALSVLKKRSGEHAVYIREFQITGKGLRVGEPLSEFEGILSGEPKFIGAAGTLLTENAQREQ